jgi:hypothetical protein
MATLGICWLALRPAHRNSSDFGIVRGARSQRFPEI